MTRIWGCIFIVLLGIGCAGQPAKPATPDAATNPAAQPEPRMREYPWMTVARWYRMHADDVEVAAAGKADVVLLGDSITESWDWGDGHREVFEKYFGGLTVANFGIGGDQTQNLAWRLKHGLKGQLDPKVAVILIGVNNFNHGPHNAEQVAGGVELVLANTAEVYPNAKRLLLAVYPFDQDPVGSARAQTLALNHRLEKIAATQGVQFLNFNHVFLLPDGSIDPALMPDYLHPNAAGLERVAQLLAPEVRRALQGGKSERRNKRSAN